MNNITSDIKNVNFSSLWPQTSYCYPLYIPDYPLTSSRFMLCPWFYTILGITYGFGVMLCNKSPNIPFTVFQMHFSQGKLNLMCMCMLWPLIGCRCAWRKFLFITWAQFKGWITLSTGKITIQWIVLYVITTLIGE